MNLQTVGTSPHRGGGFERITGQQKYVADIKLSGMLESKLVTIDSAHAKILSIDTTDAKKIPGVRLVMTSADLPQPVPRFGPQIADRPVLADGEVKFHGEPVALVVAETIEAAEEAVRLVNVQYEELPVAFTVATALDPAAPLVMDASLRPDEPLAKTNIFKEHHFGWGEIDDSKADLIVDNTYSFPMVTQFAIEPHAFIAAPDKDGIAVWSTIQHPYWLQKILANLLNLPLSKVRVYAPDPGGGFGGKQHTKYEPALVFAAVKLGCPVRLVLTLEETFQAVRRTSCDTHIRTGFTRDGKIVFQDITANYLLGAYVDIADRVVAKGSYAGAGPYNVPVVRIVSRSILSHTPPATAFRGFGNPEVNWAVESNIDEAARLLGIDRLEIRLRNLAEKGDKFIPYDKPSDGNWRQTVLRAAELIEWQKPLLPSHHRGIAVGIKLGPTTGLSYSLVRLLVDGSVIVSCGTSDMGQGARTVFAQIAAEELGVPYEKVNVIMGDTATVLYDQQTSASRSTVLMGNSVLKACYSIHAQLKTRLAKVYQIDESEITVEHGKVKLPDREAPIAELIKSALGKLGGEIVGVGEERKDAEKDHPLGGSACFYEFNCTAIEAEVDKNTGDITITRYVTVSDVGKSINPMQVHMQDEGAAVQGLGHTLMEHYIFDEKGRIRNLGAADYRILTTMDLPKEFYSETVENADGPGPYGAKGMSEGALLCVSAAVACAVGDAIGTTIKDLPLTPERVWTAIQTQKSISSPQ
ncbi:MAG: xanthine dehydrogenase family protein molybdopterin-binding subunit [Rectinema sp.]|jgi:CO/xanthine dehydrogenase Mo-binding subunit